MYNYKEMFELYRHETDPSRLDSLREDSEASLRVLRWLKELPKVTASFSHSKVPAYPQEQSTDMVLLLQEDFNMIFTHFLPKRAT